MMEIPGYTVTRELGRGGMSIVYLATQDSLCREVAVKVMAPELASDQEFRERFLREAQIIAHLVHPHIITVYDFGSQGDTFYLSMEYLRGGTLGEHIRAGLDPARSVEIIVAIAKALAYAHDEGVVHRDVKPANILFRSDDSPVLTDFGIARLISSNANLTRTGLQIGSPRYMSPEQILGQKVDSRSDLFGLGIVFFEMLTGKTPWQDTDHPVTIAVRQCQEAVPHLPPGLSQFQAPLERLLAKRAEDRYPDAEAFLDDLLSAQLPTIAHRHTRLPTPPSAGPRKGPSRALTITALTLLLLSGIGLGGYAWLQMTRSGVTDDLASRLALPPVPPNRQPRVAHYEALAIDLLRDGDLDRSLDLIRIGLGVAPEDTRLLALRKVVENHRRAEAHLQTATGLLKSGKIDAALGEVQEGLKLVPDHAGLLAAREQVQRRIDERATRRATELYKKAKATLDAGDLQQSRTLIAEGLKQAPRHPELLSLRETVEKRIGLEREIDGLILVANAMIEEGSLATASARIDAGLKLVPGHVRLTAMQKRVEALIRQRAAQEIREILESIRASDETALEQRLAMVTRGLALDPNHRELLALDQALRGQIAEQERKRKAFAEILARARRQLDAGDATGALQSVDRALAERPESADALDLKRLITRRMAEQKANAGAARHLGEARRELAEGHLDRALAAVSRGLEQVPAHEGLSSLKVEVESRIERRREASGLIKDATNAWKKGDLKTGLDLAEQAARLDPDNPEITAVHRDIQAALDKRTRFRALMKEAKGLYDTGALDQSLAKIEDARKLVPDDPEIATLNSKVSTAIQTRQAQREHAAALLESARRRREAGDLDASLELLDQGLSLQPEDEALQTAREAVLQEIGELKARAERVSRLKASAQKALSDEDLETGLASTDKALELAPEDPGLKKLRQGLQEALDRRNAATKLLDEAETLYAAGSLEAARARLEQAEGLVPDDPKARALMEKVVGEQRDREARRARATKLAETAERRRKTGDLDAALRHIDEALTLLPGDPALQARRDAVSKELRAERERREQTAVLAAKAEKDLADGALEEGLTAIEEALKLTPGDSDLSDLRRRIQDERDRLSRLDALLDRARDLLDSGDPLAALAEVEKGLSLAPGDPRLAILHDRTKDAIRRNEANQRASALLDQARAALRKGSLPTARGLLDRAAEVSPDHPDLATLRGQLDAHVSQASADRDRAEALYLQAIEARDAMKPEEARTLVDEVLELNRDHAQARTLREELDATLQQQARVQGLLNECEDHFRADRLTTGAGGNAFDCYQSVLSLEKDNPQAIEGIEQIAARYVTWSDQSLRANRPDRARLYLERLQTVSPDHPEIASLQSRISELEEAAAKPAPPASPRRSRRHATTAPKPRPKARRRETAPSSPRPPRRAESTTTPPRRSTPGTSRPDTGSSPKRQPTAPRVFGTF